MDYQKKYLKYKYKYFELLKGGAYQEPLRASSEPQYLRAMSDDSYTSENLLFTRFFNDSEINSLDIDGDNLWKRLNNLIQALEKYSNFMGSVTLFTKLLTYLTRNLGDPELISNIKQFYYYDIYRLYKRIIAYNNKEKAKYTEVYLVLQNKYDDDTVFGQSRVIYDQLAEVANITHSELHIYHTMSTSYKHQLEAKGATVNNSLSNFVSYIDILNDLESQGKKVSFLYFSAHGGYVSKSKLDTSIFGYFEGADLSPSNLSRDFLSIIFDAVGHIVTPDCNIILNSCYLGQTTFDDTELESTAGLVSRILKNNVIIAARSAILAGSLIQEFYIDELTNRMVFFGNIKVSPHEFQNRLYAYCYEATEDKDIIEMIIELFDYDNVQSLLTKEGLALFT
jgi:hypothetical protein